MIFFVVLYLSSTSNHNWLVQWPIALPLCYILLLHRTTTRKSFVIYEIALCYILLLHQTTTSIPGLNADEMLCYILLLHQTTTRCSNCAFKGCCVISYFYIKPQQILIERIRNLVVLYLTSTSNHNCHPYALTSCFVVLYLTSTSNHNHERGGV